VTGPDARSTAAQRVEPSVLRQVRATLQARREAGLWRSLGARTPWPGGRSPGDIGDIDLASNDYLRLATNPRVTAAAAQAARTWGAGSGASQLVTGHTELHAALEAALAGFTGSESALTFSSGYLANLGLVTALAGPGTLVVSDIDNHASLIDACRLSRARVEVVGHRDVARVRTALQSRSEAHAVVVTDAVFSVDGDLAPLRELHEVCHAHEAWLVVDEAHALGVVGPGGRGAAAAAGIAGEPDVLLTVTLSKALGSQGGAVLGPVEVRDLLVNTARPVIFDTALAPPATAAATEALRVLASDPGLPERARAAADWLAGTATAVGLRASRPDAAVVSVLMGSEEAALLGRDACQRHGVRVGCFRPPSVPPGRSCLRLTAHPGLTAVEQDRIRRALESAARG